MDPDSPQFGGDNDEDTDIASTDVDDAPVVRFVNQVMLDCVARGASDIHFEPYEQTYRIRMRPPGAAQRNRPTHPWRWRRDSPRDSR